MEMKKLYQHQIDIITDDKPKTGLFMGTGSGKTLTALCLARGKTLVIAPKTQKEDGNWERELKVNGLSLDLTVISKETFRRDWESLPRFDTIIIDEAHTTLGATPNIRWKDKKPIPKTSQLFEALEMFLAKTRPQRLYLCTATPIRSPMTVWAAAKLLGRDWNFYDFRDTFYFKLPIPGREAWQAKSDDVSKDHLGSLVRKLGYVGQLSDYFDVPDQNYVVKYVELTAKQKDRIKELKLEYPDPLVLCGKKHQVENGILAGDEFNAPEYFDNEKIDKILDLALEFPRLVIFAKYTAQIATMATKLRQEGYKVLTLEGSTKDRGSVLLEANNSPKCVFIAQSQVSSGWELPDFPTMVFASMSYSIVDRIQGEGRILRANHLKKNLYITLVTKGGVDEAVFKSINNKKDFNDRMYVEGS